MDLPCVIGLSWTDKRMLSMGSLSTSSDSLIAASSYSSSSFPIILMLLLSSLSLSLLFSSGDYWYFEYASSCWREYVCSYPSKNWHWQFPTWMISINSPIYFTPQNFKQTCIQHQRLIVFASDQVSSSSPSNWVWYNLWAPVLISLTFSINQPYVGNNFLMNLPEKLYIYFCYHYQPSPILYIILFTSIGNILY